MSDKNQPREEKKTRDLRLDDLELERSEDVKGGSDERNNCTMTASERSGTGEGEQLG